MLTFRVSVAINETEIVYILSPMINSTYRYYLAFENTLYGEYMSGLFFLDFYYDIVQAVRDTYVSYRLAAYMSASDFQNVQALVKNLQGLSKPIQ